MPYVQVDGVVLRYRVCGSGPPVLLLRGLGRTIDHWLGFDERLGRSFEVIALDLRGAAGSDAPWPPYSTARMADDCAGALRALGYRACHVFGFSLGGMVAQMLALRHPERVRRLVLGCSSPGRRRGVAAPLRVVPRVLTAPLRSPAAAQQAAALTTLSPQARAEHPEILERWIALQRRWPQLRRAFYGQLWAAAAHDPGDALRQVQAQTLILHGSEDALVPACNAQRLAALLPSARLIVLQGAGHDFVLERPERTARHIESFLLQPPAAPTNAHS